MPLSRIWLPKMTLWALKNELFGLPFGTFSTFWAILARTFFRSAHRNATTQPNEKNSKNSDTLRRNFHKKKPFSYFFPKPNQIKREKWEKLRQLNVEFFRGKAESWLAGSTCAATWGAKRRPTGCATTTRASMEELLAKLRSMLCRMLCSPRPLPPLGTACAGAGRGCRVERR